LNSNIDISKIEKNLDQLIEKARKEGLDPIKNRNDKIIGIGHTMPSVTELIRSELDEESTYRLLSAITHAHPFAFNQLGFRKHSKSSDKDHMNFEKSLCSIPM